MKNGLFCGIKVLIHRMRTCRNGYEIASLKNEDVLVLILKNGNVLQEHEIAERLVKQFHTTME